MSTSLQPTTRVPLWVRGDLNAFFGLGTNVLLNVIVLSGLCVFVLHFSPGTIVYGSILPALGIEMIIGNFYYAFLAYRLARRENRTSVAAMPYGPSVPHMFLVTAVIMLPTLILTHDPVLAWEAGLAWAFIVGIVVLIGVFIGPAIQKMTPRAALLGAEAGIAITFIAMLPAAEMWQAPYVALVAFAIILVGWFSNVRLPGNLPIGLVAVVVATAIGWVALGGGAVSRADLHMAALSGSFSFFGLHLPNLANVPHLIKGLHTIAPLLATAIPLGVFNFTEGINNTESAAAAGDRYNLRHILAADGVAAVVGAGLGSPFPPAIYVGHPGWKESGGRIGYSLVTGIFIGFICMSGLVEFFLAIIPIQALVPVLLYIAMVIGAQATQAVPRAHAAGVIVAFVPNLAAWAQGLISDALTAANVTVGGHGAGHVSLAALSANGVVYNGLIRLGGGAVLAGLMLGAITVFIIDREFLKAAIYSAIGAVLSLVGLIHSASIACTVHGCNFSGTWDVAVGYAGMAIVALVCATVLGVKPAPHSMEEQYLPGLGEASGEAARATGESELGVAEPLTPQTMTLEG
ncbi:MAG: regulator [Acidimicrobiales bacterium]